VGSNLLGMVNDRVDNWITGAVLGPSALGMYAMAFRLAALPRAGFTFVVSRVLFPAMTTLQDDARRLRATYLRGLHWVAACAVPASLGLVLLAPDLVRAVLGPRWEGTIVPLRILAGFGLLAALSATTGDVFKATGRSGLIFRIGLVHSAVLWLGLAALAGRGVAWVAAAVSLAALSSSTVAFTCVLRTLDLGPGALWRAVWTPLAAAAAMAAVVLAARMLLPPGAALALGVLPVVGALAYAAATAVLAPADVDVLRGRATPRGDTLAA
jgi:O-antigen/teichoic acid export membrane protein